MVRNELELSDHYSAAAQAVLDIRVDKEFSDGVTANLETLRQIAAPLMAFVMPDVEVAPRFEP